MIKSVLKEYGIGWAVNRSLYSGKLRLLSAIGVKEKLFENKAGYPVRMDIFDIDVESIREFLQSLSDEKKKELIKTADDACVGKILGFSSCILDYGYPINWQLNPLTGKACSIEKKWYDIPDLDKNRGDIKITWEASRFSHFITAARAFLLTGDKKYYKAFSEQLADWIEKNPYSYGANFKCGQECSLRMTNGLLSYTIFQKAGVAVEQDKKNMETLILRCYRKILSNFFYAYKCIRNNHTISELMGMIIGAWCCKDEKKLRYACQTLNEVIDEQFTDDGGYRQYSFNYERLALQDLEVVLSLKVKHGLNAHSKMKILAAADLMYQCQDESGDMPNYGSNDGALAFPVTSCGYRDFRPVVNSLHAMLTGTKLYETGDYDEELLWFGGRKKDPVKKDPVKKDSVKKYLVKKYPVKKKELRSTAFDNAGLYTIRKSDSWAMIVLNDYKSRPAHMDQLHFDLWVGGENIFCDGGTYSYAADKGHRLLGNAAHNTVQIDGNTQMNSYGPFMVYDWTKRKRVKHTGGLFYGAYRSKNGYEHHRTVEGTDTGYRITDQVDANGAYTILFHTPCEVVKNKDMYELRKNGTIFCRIKSSAKGEITKAIRSLYYLKKEEITCIGFSADKDTVVTEIEVSDRRKENKW